MADNRLISRIASRNGGRVLDTVIGRLLPLDAAKPSRPTLLGGLAGAVAVRIATRSVPGAIVVGGALLAKRLYDRRHAKPSGKDRTKT